MGKLQMFHTHSACTLIQRTIYRLQWTLFNPAQLTTISFISLASNYTWFRLYCCFALFSCVGHFCFGFPTIEAHIFRFLSLSLSLSLSFTHSISCFCPLSNEGFLNLAQFALNLKRILVKALNISFVRQFLVIDIVRNSSESWIRWLFEEKLRK